MKRVALGPVLAVAIALLIPTPGHAQRIENSWGIGASVGTRAVVRSGANEGRLTPAVSIEAGLHRVDASRRIGVVAQLVPWPAMRVTGLDLAGRPVTRTYSPKPQTVLRVLTDFSAWRIRSLEPSVGIGYAFYVQQPSACTSGTDSPICGAAGSIHGVHGPSAQASIAWRRSGRGLGVRARYLFTRARDVMTQDATLGIEWRRGS